MRKSQGAELNRVDERQNGTETKSLSGISHTHRDKKKVTMAEESSLLTQYGKISATQLCVAAFSTLSLSFPITLTICQNLFTTPQPNSPHPFLSFPQFDPWLSPKPSPDWLMVRSMGEIYSTLWHCSLYLWLTYVYSYTVHTVTYTDAGTQALCYAGIF